MFRIRMQRSALSAYLETYYLSLRSAHTNLKPSNVLVEERVRSLLHHHNVFGPLMPGLAMLSLLQDRSVTARLVLR
ncbi:unnamed protein product [Leptidea sinapis]|uniref:Uncharacterized protein n=1 Tax=Leptidea sinapis TaxID=189913 RepID=A0A5E4QW83_9NEOP|nr:unnamed protein product [Leptidea sinapis]